MQPIFGEDCLEFVTELTVSGVASGDERLRLVQSTFRFMRRDFRSFAHMHSRSLHVLDEGMMQAEASAPSGVAHVLVHTRMERTNTFEPR